MKKKPSNWIEGMSIELNEKKKVIEYEIIVPYSTETTTQSYQRIWRKYNEVGFIR